ncbi:MAG: hypothetical protein A3G87_09795 [Omnitrophica bacterium RIFCSPLOWO2_12_FULL_50_11]|nr:MAG: hypothetical protein A3G87_09795 [Omnitrophica bacterium RIFCSPLOWO2_12_FULL_50_11]
MTLPLRKRKRLLRVAILTGAIAIFVFFFYSLIRFAALRLFAYDFSSHEIGVLLAAAALAVLLYKPFDYLTLLFFKDVVFRSSGKVDSALQNLARAARTILDRTELANLVVNTFGETLGVRVASILAFDRIKACYRVVSAFGIKTSDWQFLDLKETDPFVQLLKARRMPLEREAVVKSFSWQEANHLTHDFEKLHASLVIPMFYDEALVGSINLLPDGSSKRFTAVQMRFLVEFACEAAIAFRNAALYEELKHSNQELMKIQSELLYSAQHSAIAQLAVGVAHEIHNPLTIISGKAQVLLLKRDQIAYDGQVEEVLKTIVKQTKRAVDITRKLMMFSDSPKSTREWIDFEELVNDTIALLSYQVSLDQIQVVKRFIHPIPKWYGNVGELREAFLNLFLNAVQAIGTNGTIEVSVAYRELDQVMELKVSDSGVGIPENHLARVFQPFFTTREGATGLGLFLVQQIVRGYDGTIRTERRTKGATFVVELPAAPRKEQDRFGHRHGGEVRPDPSALIERS